MKEIVRRLADEFHPLAIYLFGSQAWGTPDDGSDLDFLIVISESVERPAARATRAYACVEDIMVPMDIVVQTQEEFERYLSVASSLAHRIEKEGRRLYG